VTLAVTWNTICGRVLRRRSVSAFQGHRLPWTASRWDVRLLIGRRTKPTFCVFPVFSVAVMEKCCDACGNMEYYFGPGSQTSRCLLFRGIDCRDRKSMGHTVADRRRTKPTFCVFPLLGLAVMEKCCDACGDGKYYFRSAFSAPRVPAFQRHRLPLTRSR
jgi:hypothetical protein